MVSIYDPEFYKSDFGREMARKYWGFRYDNQGQDQHDNQPVHEDEPQGQSMPQGDRHIDGTKQEPNFSNIFKTDVTAPLATPARSFLSTEPPSNLTLSDLIRHYRNQGVVGEESLVCAITLAALNGSSFGLEGYSGSGKTFIVDRLVDLLPSVYRISQSSPLAVFNDADRINGSKFIYIPELQKVMQEKRSPIIEVLKDLTEGKDAHRIATRKDGNGVQEYSIRHGISIIYTLAVENHFKKDEESSRRLIRFRTDASPEHFGEIHTEKARKRYAAHESRQTMEDLECRVRDHIAHCHALDVQVIDPFAPYILELIPQTQKSVGYIDHYYALLDGCARFHYRERTIVEANAERYLITALEDHYAVFAMYFSEFIKTLKDMATDQEQEMEMVLPIPDWGRCFQKGYEVLRDCAELERVRSAEPGIVDRWYTNQVRDGRIVMQDYMAGTPIELWRDMRDIEGRQQNPGTVEANP